MWAFSILLFVIVSLLGAIYLNETVNETMSMIANKANKIFANAVDNDGNTAFIMTGHAQTHAADLTRLLAKAGADVHAVNRDGANALMIALKNGHEYKSGPQTVRLLMNEFGLKPTPRLADGSTALTIAAKADQSAEILRLLVASGADVNAADANEMTPLMIYAAQTYNTGAMDYLIAAGADVNRRNAAGQSAADLARSNAYLRGNAILKRLNEWPCPAVARAVASER